jgi:hypothetical protein
VPRHLRTRPRQLEGRQATGVSSRGWLVGWRRRSVGARLRGGRIPSRRRCSARPPEGVAVKLERWQSRSGGVSSGAGGGERRYQSQRPAARAAPGASGARGEAKTRGIGRFDRSVSRTELVWFGPAGRPGRGGPARPNGLWPV